MTEELKKQLILAGPFVVYGKPSMATVTNLMNKKAYTLVYGFYFALMQQVDGKRTAISDNLMVEKALGEHNIICIADIVDEIQNLGPHFELIQNYLCAFKLKDPSSYINTTLLHNNKLPSGDLGDEINAFVKNML